jgi:hypothetical protein
VVRYLGGEGVGERTSVGLARSDVLEVLVLGVEELVGLGDGDAQREPVTGSRRLGGGEAVRVEPGLNGGGGVSSRGEESIDLARRKIRVSSKTIGNHAPHPWRGGFRSWSSTGC